MIIYLNNIRLELEDNGKIAQTKQVNDWFSIATRQTNFTNSFKIPRTAKNVRAFKNLGIVGNTSDIPYTLNKASLFSDAGECFVFNGRINITQTNTDYYSVQIIDGNVDLYKDMANDKLSVLDLSEVNHDRNINNILETWNESIIKNYKYIVSDYNGKLFTNEGYLSADSLVPSVRVSWLWDKLFQHYGYTYTGTTFDSDIFKSLWVTYPNGIEFPTALTVPAWTSNLFTYNTVLQRRGIFMNFTNNTFIDPELIDLTGNGLRWRIKKSGKYKFKCEGNFHRFRGNADMQISLGKNLTGTINPLTDSYPFPVAQNLGATVQDSVPFERETVMDLAEGDVIHMMVKSIGDLFSIIDDLEPVFKLEIQKLEDIDVNFNVAFDDFGVKDFFNEITNRFGIIPIKDKYSSRYDFYTFDEMLYGQTSKDWSKKFVSFEKETYLYSGFEKNNYFRFKYDQKDQEHNDGFLQVNNENLDDKKTVYQSQLYSPEKGKVTFYGRSTNVYKFYDKQIKEDMTITYKPLSKRFFFMSYETFEQTGILKSEFYIDQDPFTSFPIESFQGIDYISVISANYSSMGVLLNNSAVISAKMKLTDLDIAEVDFSKKIFIRQMGSFYLLNKISNYLNSKTPVSVEFIKLNGLEDLNNPSSQNVITSINWRRVDSNTMEVEINYTPEFFAESSISLKFFGYRTYNDLPNTGTVAKFMTTVHNNVPMRVQLFTDTSVSEIKTYTPSV